MSDVLMFSSCLAITLYLISFSGLSNGHCLNVTGLFIYPSTTEYISPFQSWAVINEAAVSAREQGFVEHKFPFPLVQYKGIQKILY